MAKPVPVTSYEFCRGESPVGTHICDDREMCKRFMPKSCGVHGLNFSDFWVAKHCPKFELRDRAQLPEEVKGLDW